MISGSLLGLPAEDWSALAAWATVGLALLAGGIAFVQLREARRLRVEQAQPYVVAYLDESSPGAWFFDLVIKNFGATAAVDVRVEITPEPRGVATGKPVEVPHTIELLVPGQEWRTFWDSGRRAESDLPDRHEVTVSFKQQGSDERMEYQQAIDWRQMRSRITMVRYGEHESAKALRDIEKTLKGWTEKTGRRGVAVTVRDGNQADEELRARFEAAQAREAEDATDSADSPE